MDGISDTYGGVQQCWIMFMGEEGAGSVSHWHHVHFCFTVAGPVFLRVYYVTLLSFWNWVSTAEFFQVTMTVCRPVGVRLKWLPLESPLPAVHGLMFSRHSDVTGCSLALTMSVRANREGWSWSHVSGLVHSLLCGGQSLHALHWCVQVR